MGCGFGFVELDGHAEISARVLHAIEPHADHVDFRRRDALAQACASGDDQRAAASNVLNP